MTAPSFFAIRSRSLLPIVQGGMGIGISAHRLAGAVARAGAVGTIASIDLRHHHTDLSEQAKHCRDKDELNRLNLIALDREIKTALDMASDRGLVAVNVMKAVDEYPAIVRQACASGAQAIVMGAGLPLDLPELAEGYPDVALIPILSDARGVAIVLKKWARLKKSGGGRRLPDAIVIEHPLYAGGHLGAPNPADLTLAKFDFAEVLPGIFKLFDDMGIARGQIPVIVGGGINSHEKMLGALALGASAVQLGTPFAVTEEGDAHPNFKRVLAEARPEDIVTFMSVAGLPARAVNTPWLANYLKREPKLQAVAKADPKRCAIGLHCLTQCGLRDGLEKAGQFCIDSQLVAALKGDVNKGLFFRGSEPLPFGSDIRPVQDLIDYLLTGVKAERVVHEPVAEAT
ncbi:MAG TPA: nitronate monooxygenase family protein [Thiobacillus sp.]|nr:MAG: 2-nitropropane dioxygenase [Hydrogenophilales bacterium 28-61-11]OYZ57954.1 MAG: 2-nitropropane dioxygenase [Hydrogenophilales bacterium 16-61-112]OZA42241.1 MAG: 2-nitropropane dioxygenase [Hydrogenophilales bacterium 17-61-76]HQS81638.1 nitronate monooxygenase family protein [Thiobacillus sp.]HQT32181.1 nitronate monooxygenase family protein [Thiobacillus sp.]